MQHFVLNLTANNYIFRNQSNILACTKLAKTYMDKYVPLLSGELKNTSTVTRLGNSYVVQYGTDYAKKQYYTNNGNGLRGNYWNLRMLEVEGDTFFKECDNIFKNF